MMQNGFPKRGKERRVAGNPVSINGIIYVTIFVFLRQSVIYFNGEISQIFSNIVARFS